MPPHCTVGAFVLHAQPAWVQISNLDNFSDVEELIDRSLLRAIVDSAKLSSWLNLSRTGENSTGKTTLRAFHTSAIIYLLLIDKYRLKVGSVRTIQSSKHGMKLKKIAATVKLMNVVHNHLWPRTASYKIHILQIWKSHKCASLWCGPGRIVYCVR